MSKNVLLPFLTEDMDIVVKLPDEPTNEPTQDDPDGMSPEEFKAKFDEAGNIIKRYINESLLPELRAGNIPFEAYNAVPKDTVQDAIRHVQEQIVAESEGLIPDGSVSESKLSEDVYKLLYTGIPMVSAEAPYGEHPVGKVWIQVNQEGTNVVALWYQYANGLWWKGGFDVLPTERGGTGKTGFANGGLLYGKNGGIEQTANPTEDGMYLTYKAGAPKWEKASELGDFIERIKTAHGSYEGNGRFRRVEELPVAPKVIFITNETTSNISTAGGGTFQDGHYILTQGQTAKRRTSKSDYTDTSNTNYVEEYVTLNGNKLTFTGKKAPGGSNDIDASNARVANSVGSTYAWVAIY